MKKTFRNIIALKLIIASSFVSFYFSNFYFTNAATNPEINYQGRLLDASGDPVSDADYNIQFKLYTASSGGSPVWTETHCYSPDSGSTCNGTGSDQRIEIIDGLFSVMLGSVNSLQNVDFNQTLYLSINIGGSGSTPSYDGEMSPRKKLGSVPSAFESTRLNGITSDQFLRNDILNATNSSQTFFSLSQEGSGKVAEFFGPSSASLFTVQSNGNVGIGTSTPSNPLHVYDNQYGWNMRYGGETNVNRLGWYNGSSLQFWIDGNNTGNTSQIGFFNSRLDIGSSALSITNGGDVGVGTTSPSKKFAVAGDVLFSNGSDTKFFLGNASNYFQTNGDLQAFAQNSLRFNANGGAVFFQNNGGAKFQLGGTGEGDSDLFVSDTGSFGVGTTSPYAKLSVDGDIALTGGLYDSAASLGTSGYVLQTTGTGIQWVATSTLGISGGSGGSPTTPVAFSVHRNGSAQSVTNGVYTAMNWTHEEFDTNNSFDLSTDRFTPTVEGYYQVTAKIYCTAAATSCYSSIYKNGSMFSTAGLSAGSSIMPATTQVIYMNGTTDYLEAYVYAAGTAVFGEPEWTSFSGVLVSSPTGSGGGWVDSGDDIYLLDSANSVGIGTSTPYAKLTVAGDTAITGGLFDSNATKGTSGYVLQTTGTGIQWVATSTLGISGGGVGGSNTHVQFNDGGVAGGESAFTYDKTTDKLTVGGSIQSDTVNSSDLLDYGFNLTTSGLNVYDNTSGAGSNVNVGSVSVFDGGSGYSYLTPDYLNFSVTTGASGFGIRNNAGTIEYKNSGGTWTPLNEISGGATLNDSDFFESNDFVNNTTAQFDPFTAAAISSGTLTTPLSTAMTSGQTPGVVRLRSSTTANGGYRIQTPAGHLLLDDNMMFEGVMQLQTGTGVTVRLGFHDSVTSADAVDGAYFEISGTTVTGKTSNNSTRSTTASNYSITAGGANWYKYRIVLNSNASTVTYYIYNLSGTQLWTDSLSANIPTATGRETAAGIVATESSTTATDMVHLDYMGIGTVAGYDSVMTSGAGLWTTSGADAYYNLGKIGIGTATPQRKFHVYTSADEAPVRFQDSNGYCEINPTSTTWTCTSDERLKDNILDVASSTDNLYEKMRQLRPVTFEWKSDETNTTRVGFIAQEVEQIFPDFVTTDPETGLKAVSYGSFVPYIVSFIQDLANKIDELAKRIDEFAVNSFAALTIGSSQKPAGITIYDEVTGDPYCMSVKNGNMVTKFGACGDSVQEQEVGDSNDTPPAISNFNQNIELEPEQDIEFNNGTSSEESVESAQEQVEIIEDVETSEPEVEIEVEPQQVQEEEVSQEAEIIVETNQSSGSVDLPVE